MTPAKGHPEFELPAAGSHHQTARCYLLELPAELRNVIFELALYHSNGVVVNRKEDNVNDNAAALTETCSQIRRECGDLYFTQNIFVFKFRCRKNLDFDEIRIHRRTRAEWMMGLPFCRPNSRPLANYDEEWHCERRIFNRFIARHVEGLIPRIRQVRVQLDKKPTTDKDLSLLQNLSPIRYSIRLLRKHKSIHTRFSIWFFFSPHHKAILLNLELSDEVDLTSEIGRQMQESLTETDVRPEHRHVYVGYAQQILTEAIQLCQWSSD